MTNNSLNEYATCRRHGRLFYADSARRAYVNSIRDVYLATERAMYLAEYKLALIEARPKELAPGTSQVLP